METSETSPNGAKVINNRATTFLSRDLAILASKIHRSDCNTASSSAQNIPPAHFDVIIVGSGYGGAVAADSFSKCTITDETTGKRRPIRVCVLERGKEFLPGAFPSGFADLPGQLRIAQPGSAGAGGNALGLFEIRLGAKASAVVANGLGGGSLINAGVLLEPSPQIIEKWPSTLQGNELQTCYQDAKQVLGVEHNSKPNTVAKFNAEPLKYKLLNKLGGNKAQPVPVSIALENETGNPVSLNACIGCGDCAQGCNHNAKKSLDTNLLAKAVNQGAEIYCGATVERFDKHETGWQVYVNYSDPTRRKRTSQPLVLRCTKLVMAAGTYATSEIMFRSQHQSSHFLNFSDMLGNNFSGNGDNIAAITNCNMPVNMAADETIAPGMREVGPTITGMIDARDTNDIPLAIQELSIPAALKGILTEVLGLVRIVHALTDQQAADAANSDDYCYVSTETLDNSAIMIMMGDDGASGRLVYDRATSSISVQWPDHHSHTRNHLYKAQIDYLKALAKKHLGVTAVVHDNPSRNPLGEQMQQMMKIPEGPVLTVHPLGGCIIGDNVETGVVNDCGQVFNASCPQADGTALQHNLYDDLVVLDGSILPGAPGINPALSITAIALRATKKLKERWLWEDQSKEHNHPLVRPRYTTQTDPEKTPPARRPTEIAITERLVGNATLICDDKPVDVVIEMSLETKPVPIALCTNDILREIELADPEDSPTSNTIRIFDRQDWNTLFDPEHSREFRTRTKKTGSNEWLEMRAQFDKNPDKYLDSICLLSTRVSGSIHLFKEVERASRSRLIHGFSTWVRNRGAREYLWSAKGQSTGVGKHLSLMCALWKHAGRERYLEYELQASPPTKPVNSKLANLITVNSIISGKKRFRYQSRSNPWRQMSEIDLITFPGLADETKPRLVLDLFYLARKKSPLMTIVSEETLPDGYTDLTMFGMRFFRELLLHHFFSFMAPHDWRDINNDQSALDTFIERKQPQTVHSSEKNEYIYNMAALPQELPDLKHHSEWICVDSVCDKNRYDNPRNLHYLHARITRYSPLSKSHDTPVLLIHGYSASGTTFAHNLLSPGLVQHLCNEGREVWVLDMRTSCALHSASHDWDFEDMAYHDIPAAIDYITSTTGCGQVDVVAHCMGAVMLSMSILGTPAGKQNASLKEKIRKIVLSQAGPVLRFSAANTFRAFMMHYLKNLLPQVSYTFFPAQQHEGKKIYNEGNYQFNPPEVLTNGVTGGDQMMDRLLATLPYPDDSEFDLEYPLGNISPYVRERHRMDVLYGRTFSLRNMSAPVLGNLHDFFGPLSIETVKQTIHFANTTEITDRHGKKILRSPESIRQHWTMPTLWVHGAENGLIDPCSPLMTARLFDTVFPNRDIFDFKIHRGLGHQDSLMGINCQQVYIDIALHLS